MKRTLPSTVNLAVTADHHNNTREDAKRQMAILETPSKDLVDPALKTFWTTPNPPAKDLVTKDKSNYVGLGPKAPLASVATSNLHRITVPALIVHSETTAP